MAARKSAAHLRTAHVLFVDAVGYSKLLVNEQGELVQRLTQIVRGTAQFRKSRSAGRLIRIPTGDGMALVFFQTPEEPVQCAMEIARALKNEPDIRLRMGVHSGPVDHIKDVNNQANVAGVGINVAQRVMALGDAGHILATERVAADLAEDNRWHAHLHPLGEVELKHGVKVGIVNVYNDDIGNPQLPAKLQALKETRDAAERAARTGARNILRRKPASAALALVLVVAAGLGFWKFHQAAVLNRTGALERIPEKSIAILPFDNLSNNQENSFFTDGVQDEILTNLARIADLKVISRTSTMQYRAGAKRNLRDIGKALGVAHVVEGSVQRTDNRVRVNAQLIDARTDAHLWAQTYDRDLADVFAIQSEIATTIADQLRVELSPSEKAAIQQPLTTDLAAYELYRRAQALFAETTDTFRANQKLPQAARLLNEAVDRDPKFLLAWCMLANVHGNLYWYGYDHTSARLDLAHAAVQAALSLQPDSGDARLALAKYYYHGFRDYGRARSELAVARRTLPNNAEVSEYTAYIDRREGHWEEATRNLERALELDPRNFDTVQQLADTYKPQRRYADAVRVYDHALTIVPGDPGNLRLLRSHIAVDWRADIKLFQSILATMLAEDPSVGPDLDGNFPDYALCERTAAAAARMLANYPRDGATYYGTNCPHSYWEGVVARWQGDPAKGHAAFSAARGEVEKILEKQPDFAAALSLLGIIDAGLERKEEALREGRRACELLPTSKDAIDGEAFVINLAQIYAWTGEKDLAIEQIAAIERVPNDLSYGLLKLHPFWDSLRGDPRFEQIVASLAPE
jgi:TolB-like protein/Tfp pilus assembly protein PilF